MNTVNSFPSDSMWPRWKTIVLVAYGMRDHFQGCVWKHLLGTKNSNVLILLRNLGPKEMNEFGDFSQET